MANLRKYLSKFVSIFYLRVRSMFDVSDYAILYLTKLNGKGPNFKGNIVFALFNLQFAILQAKQKLKSPLRLKD